MADRPVLQPIIKRSHSPSQQAISNEALRSPTFIEEPTSPNLANAATAAVATGGKHSPQTAKAIAQGSYFALQPPATTAPSPSTGGILLNRLDREGVASPPAAEAPVGDGGASSAALLRVASPDGSASESGASEMGQPAPSTAPTSAAGSPVPAHSVGGVGTAQKPNLSTLFMAEPSTDAAPGKTPHSATTPVDPSQPGSVRRVSSPPSPHCHFAPLPRVDTERPLPRRESSTANRVKPFVPKVLPKGLERTDSILATGSTATTNAPQASSADASRDEGGLPSPQRLWHAGDSSIPSAAALSQRLSSSLTFVDAPSLSPNPSSTGATGTASPGSRPTSRRSSSSRRSRSPSPHYYNQNRDRYRNVSATSASTAATGAGPEARTQSPNLSRHASTDALSLHYIEQQRDYSHHHHHHRDGTTRSESGGRIISRTSSRAGSERDATEASASADRSRRSSTSRVRASTSTATAGAVPFVDRDKEADLHRLETKALAGNADAERCVSPALRAHEEQQRALGVQQQQQQQRERSTSRGGLSAAAGAAAHATGSDGGESKSQVLKRTNSHEEVVQIKPPSGDGGEPERGDGELEEVLEEPEEAEAEAEAAGTRLVGEDDDEDEDEDDVDDEEDDDGDDDEDDDEDEEEDDNEEDRSREEENDDDEEEEEEPAEDRKTSLGAGVEVVRWHRAERDSAPPTPAIAQHQTPTTLSAPSSPPPPPVAGLPPVSAPTSPVSPGVAASS